MRKLIRGRIIQKNIAHNNFVLFPKQTAQIVNCGAGTIPRNTSSHELIHISFHNYIKPTYLSSISVGWRGPGASVSFYLLRTITVPVYMVRSLAEGFQGQPDRSRPDPLKNLEMSAPAQLPLL